MPSFSPKKSQRKGRTQLPNGVEVDVEVSFDEADKLFVDPIGEAVFGFVIDLNSSRFVGIESHENW